MKHFTQWDDAEISVGSHVGDDPPPGWTKRFDAGSSPNDFTRRVGGNGSSEIFVTPPVKRRYLRSAQTAAGRGALSWDRIDNDQDRADVEALALYIAGDNLESGAFIVARGSTAATTAYYAGLSPAADEIRIAKVVAGTPTDLDTDTFAVAARGAYWMRFRVNGTSLSFKAWAVGDDEPSAWMLTATDSAISAAGFVGLWNEGNATQGAWNVFACATDGDTAVRPITEDEYAAWLDRQDVRRCVLAEMFATGFSPASADYTKAVPYYLSNTGYNSHEQDSPAQRGYPAAIASIPPFKREMGAALRGRVTVGFGSLEVRNPRPSAAEPGVRDKWLRQKWQKSTVTLLLGDPEWPRHDFRPYLVGRLQPPTAPRPDVIVFPLKELSDVFSEPVQSTVFSGGTNFDGAFKPLTVGRATMVEPPLYDSAELLYKVHDGAIVDFILEDPTSLALVYDSGVSLSDGPFTVNLVNTGSETIQTLVATGVVVNYVVVFTAGTPPAPLQLDTKYYVESTPASTQFTLATTRGGSVINLTGTDMGATFYVHGFDCVDTDGDVQLATNATGRVVVDHVETDVTNAPRIANMIEWVLFDQYGLSRDYLDDESFTALETALVDTDYDSGVWVDKARHTVGEVIDDIASGSNTWVGTTPAGAMQVGQLDLPEATAVMSFGKGDIAEGSLRQLTTILPVDFSKTDIVAAPVWLTGGPYQIGGVDIEPYSVPPYTYGADATPIDTPQQGDVQPKSTFQLVFPRTGAVLEQARLATLFGKQLGTFEFRTRLSAITLRIGQTIELEHPREGWRAYTAADGPSPDNPAPFDATKAVVVGIAANLSSHDPFMVTLTVLRQLPQHAPEFAEDLPPAALQVDFARGTLVPILGSESPTFTRATVAWEQDWEGIWRGVFNGEARFRGLRRVANLAQVTSEDFSDAAWTKSSITVSGGGNTLTASGANGEVTQALIVPASSGNASYRVRAKLTRVSGTGNIQLRIGATYKTVAVTTTPTVFCSDVVSGAGVTWGLRIVTSGDAVVAEEIQLEDVSGQADQAPGEYVSVGVESSPYHGAGVDGVRYFPYENGNTVASNVVTEAEGVAISRATARGFHREPAATNTVTAPRDLTDAAWTPINATVAKDQVGVDGHANGASKLTATAIGGGVVQALAGVASAPRVFSVFMKRITGTGVVAISLDSGATSDDVSSQINSSTWTRVYRTQTLAARTLVIAFGTNGDAVAVDFIQEEAGASPTTPIDTPIVATRNADALSYTSTALAKAAGTQYAEIAPDVGGNAPADTYAVTTEASDQVALYVPSGGQTVTGYLGANRATKSTTLTAGGMAKWAHRWDAVADEVFVNGVRGSAAAGSAFSGASTTLYVGANAAGTGAGAAIGRIAVWKQPLALDHLADLTT